jgi:hypothetical protein
MTEFVEMAKCKSSGAIMIEHDIGDTGSFDVRGDADRGKRDSLWKFCVDEEKAVDGAANEEVGIFLEEVGTAEMTDSEIKISSLKEVLLDAEHEAGEVAFAEFRDDYADGVGESGAEHAGMKVGAVIELLRGIEDALLSLGRDGFGDG